MAQVIQPNVAYQRPGHIWDHMVTAQSSAPAATTALYSVGIGGTGYGVTNKTKYDTNLQQGNRQNPGETFVATQLGFRFNPQMKLSDIFLILNACYFEFYLQAAGAIFAEGPLWLYPSGGGISGVTTNTNESVWDIGVPNILVARAWGVNDGFSITDQMYLGVQVIFPGTPPTMLGANGLDLWVILDGLKSTLVHG